jgi:hypothetical protein
MENNTNLLGQFLTNITFRLERSQIVHYQIQASDTLVSPYINIRHNVLDCDRFDKRHCQRLIHGREEDATRRLKLKVGSFSFSTRSEYDNSIKPGSCLVTRL